MIETLKKESIRYSNEDSVMYNIEEVPAETASGTLALKDKILFKGDRDFYNSQFVPLSYNIPLGKRVEVESKFQNITTGGSIAHLNVLGTFDEINGFTFQDSLIKKSNMVHFAINRGFTMCKNGHNVFGVYDTCPTCGSKDLDWLTRIVGYFVPLKQWNKTKQLEFGTRKWYN